MENKNKPTFKLWEVIVLVIVSSLIMSSATGYMIFRSKGIEDCVQVASNPYIGELISSYNKLIDNFHLEIDEADLVNAAIKGMIEHLGDPHSSFLNERETESLLNSLSGTFKGIGISLTIDEEEPTIIQVFEESPAERAGVLPGDIIRIVNEIEVQGKTSDEIVGIIRNSEDPNIKLIVERDYELIEFDLAKELIPIPQVHSQVFEKSNQRVGYLRIDTFSEIIGTQFQRRLNELESENIDSLIIDLRNNTGGHLKGAVDIASMFLQEGSVVYQLRVRGETTKEVVITEESRDYRIYILINGMSASAAEILAAALRESHHAEVLLIGEQSFGKGFIQTTATLPNGSMFKYTNAEWLTPTGEVVEDRGLTPDIEIIFNDEHGRFPDAENDNQLQAALTRIVERRG